MHIIHSILQGNTQQRTQQKINITNLSFDKERDWWFGTASLDTK